MSSPAPSVRPAPSEAPRRNGSYIKWYIIGGIVLLVAGGVVLHFVKRGKAEIIAVTTDKAVVKTITQTVTATGKVQPETEVKISPQVSGEIIKLPYREGASVKKGDLLVAIKPDIYRFQVEQAQASLVAAKASADDSKARMLQAEADFKRSQDLHAKNLVSDADFSTAKTTFESAQATYANAMANITHAEGAVSQAQDQLNQTTMYSPIDGKISLLNNEVGETVASTGQGVRRWPTKPVKAMPMIAQDQYSACAMLSVSSWGCCLTSMGKGRGEVTTALFRAAASPRQSARQRPGG
jgi:HlyD family secretion protein